jgi:hypothetical protein
MFVLCSVCVLSGRGLCDGPIHRQKESYRMWSVLECSISGEINYALCIYYHALHCHCPVHCVCVCVCVCVRGGRQLCASTIVLAFTSHISYQCLYFVYEFYCHLYWGNSYVLS